MHVHFKRILHPVGHGAFFTEQISSESVNSEINIVFDCGSQSKNKLFTEIERTKNKENITHIHVLFISHLDEDHVNGIQHLIKCDMINSDTVVILPFRHPELLKIFALDNRIHFPRGVRYSINSLFSIGVRFIGMTDEGEDEREFEHEIRHTNYSLEEILNNTQKNIILTSSTELFYDKLWCYITYMTCNDKQVYKEFKQAVKEEGLDITKLNKPFYVKENKKLLKRIYKNMPNEKYGNTIINANSLQLLSMANDNMTGFRIGIYNKVLFVHLAKNEYHGLFAKFKPPFWLYDYSFFQYSCLYCGDTKMNDVYLNRIRQKLNVHLYMLQIPHHGRKNCYDENILSKIQPKLIFINDKVSCNSNISTIKNNRSKIKLIEITDNLNSIFYFYVDF